MQLSHHRFAIGDKPRAYRCVRKVVAVENDGQHFLQRLVCGHLVNTWLKVDLSNCDHVVVANHILKRCRARICWECSRCRR